MSTVPVFAPTGELGDIPAGKLNDAVKAGFQPGVHVQSADGQDGVIPAHRTADAVKAGMKVVPIEDQPIKHEGFWSSLASDLGGMAAGATQIPQMMSAGPAGFLPTAANMAINNMQRGFEGRSTPYRAIAPVGEALGVNVRGMEEAANQGDVGGVAGHAAAVPTAMTAAGLVGELPLGRIAQAAGGALKGGAERLPIVGPVAKGAIRGALKSWRASAPPEVEIPASKVSTTPPEPRPVSKSSQLQQSRALQNVPTSQAAPTSASEQLTTGPLPNRFAPIQLSQGEARPAVQDPSTIVSRMRALTQKIREQGISAPETTGPSLRIAGKDVPASTDLAPALKESLPQNRVQGKIMQVLRKEGAGSTVGIDRLMEAPQLKGISREQVIDAARSLRDQGKIWHEQTGGGAHPVSYTMALKAR